MEDTNIEKLNEFRKELGLTDSTLIVVGSMIGSGIFIVSADIARTVGSPGWLLVTWLITGIVTLIAALSYGELAAMMPKAGGQYVYLREAWNPLTGFLYGWTFALVIQTGTIAAVAVAFAKYTGIVIPFFSEKNILLNVIGFKFTAAQLLAIISIAALTYINTKGIRIGKIIQDIFTITKSSALLLLIIAGLILGAGSLAMHTNFSSMWDASRTIVENDAVKSVEPLSGFMLVAAIGIAMVGSLFSSDAWNNITFTAAEIKNPKRDIPKSLFYGTAIVTVLYLLANLSYLFVLPLSGDINGTTPYENGIQFASSDRVGTAAVSVFLGSTASYVMAILIMISTFGCNNGLILTGARLTYAMSNDKLFFKKAGMLNKHGVPANSLTIQAIWASVLCLTGTYSDLLDYVVFAVMLFYIFTIAGIFKLRKTKPDVPRPYKAFGYPVLPALYILFAVSFSVVLLIFKPNYTYPGLIIVIIGIPVYLIWKKTLKNKHKISGNP